MRWVWDGPDPPDCFGALSPRQGSEWRDARRSTGQGSSGHAATARWTDSSPVGDSLRTAPTAGTAPPGLRRDLGLLDAVGIGFGAIVGAGIFVVTGVAAGIAGPAFLLGLLVAGIAATANALSSAQLAAEYPQSGGTYEYGYQVLNPWAGFAAGWMFLASKISAAGTVALGLAGYLAGLVPGLPPRAVAVTAILFFTLLNYFGVRRSSRANLTIVAVSLGSLLLFVALGASAFRSENLVPFAPQGWRGVLEAAAILFFAYTGYARIATLGEEVHEPRKSPWRPKPWPRGLGCWRLASGRGGSRVAPARRGDPDRGTRRHSGRAESWGGGFGRRKPPGGGSKPDKPAEAGRSPGPGPPAPRIVSPFLPAICQTGALRPGRPWPP
ncbi:MAG TPA: amino acid permease [Gemmatimonadales bacterium]|nr:amino acid permease [Gemmatimonadales bacterium]